MIEILNLRVSRKIKSIQSFKESLKCISSGDRAGICVQSIESESIERTLISNKPLMSRSVLLLEAKRVKYYKNDLRSKSKIHISVLNESVLCKQIFIVKPTIFGFEYLEKVEDEQEKFHVIVELDKSINILPGAIIIGSKLDSHPSLQKCRIAFYGKWTDVDFDMKPVNIYKSKLKYSFIDRIVSENRLIGKGLVSELNNFNCKQGKDSISKYIGMKVTIFNDNLKIGTGVIDSLFGSSGKFNVTLNGTLLSVCGQLYLKLSYGKVIKVNKEEDDDKEKMIEIN
jgi:hypothetical protein